MRKFIIIGSSALAFLILIAVLFSLPAKQNGDPSASRSIYADLSSKSCNVATIAISGFLDSEESSSTPYSSWDISQSIRNLDLRGKKALIVFLDSDGGLPEAAGEVASALQKVNVPTVAYVRGDALSGGYWIAASTDHIIALPTALIGNIGVNSSFLTQTKANADLGYSYQEIISGQFKDAGDPDKVPTAADLEFLRGVNTDLFNLFKDVVMNGRGMSTAQFAAVADAKFYVAPKAKDLGLIDEIGDIDTVENYLSAKTGTNLSDISLCDFPDYAAVPSAY